MTAIFPALLLTAVSLSGSDPDLRFTINEAQSHVTATVAFLGMSHKTARFQRVSGSVEIANAAIEAIMLDVALDARTVTAADKAMVGQLRGAAFFDAEHHPTIRFQGTRLRLTGAKTGVILGQLTIRGITRPVTLTVAFSKPITQFAEGQPIFIDGQTIINRREFGMTAYPMLVGRDVTIRMRTNLLPSDR